MYQIMQEDASEDNMLAWQSTICVKNFETISLCYKDLRNINSSMLIEFVCVTGRFMIRKKTQSGQFRVIEHCYRSAFVNKQFNELLFVRKVFWRINNGNWLYSCILKQISMQNTFYYSTQVNFLVRCMQHVQKVQFNFWVS